MHLAGGVICDAATSQSRLRKCTKCGNHDKSKVHLRTGHEGPERDWRYGCTLSLTSAPNGVRGQRHTSAALPFGKKTGTILPEAGWALGPVWTGTENVTPAGIRSPDRPALSGPCTDYAISAHVVTMATSNDHGNLSGYQCFRVKATEKFSVSVCVRACPCMASDRAVFACTII
jgi:hypothetical protein